jgi:glycine/serine hydroxymethyltransferase
MTRFGIKEADFQELAQLIRDALIERRSVKEEVASYRKRFLEMKYCFSGKEFDDLIHELSRLL